MDPRKRSASSTTTAAEVEVAVVKAAAWAWYQHGSGNDSKPSREFDLAPTHRSPRPTRYKLEALRMDPDPSIPSPTGSDKSLLLDLYEIERITQELNHLIMQVAKEMGPAEG